MAGRTFLRKKIVDSWLMQNPGKKALLLDPKSDKSEIRYFVPNKQLCESKEVRTNGG